MLSRICGFILVLSSIIIMSFCLYAGYAKEEGRWGLGGGLAFILVGGTGIWLLIRKE